LTTLLGQALAQHVEVNESLVGSEVLCVAGVWPMTFGRVYGPLLKSVAGKGALALAFSIIGEPEQC
jgi:hypothetical protein